MLEYTTLAFFRVDPTNNNLLLPKKERLHRLNVSSYNYYLHKYFKPKEFEIEKNYVENEIYHYSVEDDDIKNFITGKMPINYHLISVSLIYNKPYVTQCLFKRELI